MQTIDYQYVNSPVGELIIGSFNDQLCLLDYKNRKAREGVDKRLQKGLNAEYRLQNTDVIELTKTQLNEYFNQERQSFDIPLLTVGTDFQNTVWSALQKIEYGTTSSYQQLANTLNNTNAVRAVANANGANAISIIIPCHRIIGSNGHLTGYAGGLDAKQFLLDCEQSEFQLS